MPSFDVVSEVDLQEVDNAVNQVKKEIETRYDLKGSDSTIEFSQKDSVINIQANDSMKLKSIAEILNQKAAKRGISVRSLEYKDASKSSGDKIRQVVAIKKGITTEDGKKIVKIIKEIGIKKSSAQIQDDQVRVTGPKRDDLQQIIQVLKTKVTDLDLQFTNFRD